MDHSAEYTKAKALPQLSTTLTPDVFIAGSGPIGATFAAELHRINPKLKILMTDIGGLDTAVPGSHKKNSIDFQKDIDRFVHIIQGDLSTVSVPVTNVPVTNADPEVFLPWYEDIKVKIGTDPNGRASKWFVRNNQNPEQKPEFNLGAEAVTRCVGGMSTHWTCACPELHPELERPRLEADDDKNNAEWTKLYKRAKELIGVGDTQFSESIRHQLVLDTLIKEFPAVGQIPPREFKALPLACERDTDDPRYVTWHSAHTILKTLGAALKVDEEEVVRAGDFFELYPNTRCTRVWQLPNKGEIDFVECTRLRLGKVDTNVQVKAKVYIIAAGAVGTPQILANSFFAKEQELPALGKYITEQTMAFCQIMLYRDLIAGVREKPKPEWQKRVEDHIRDFPLDPIAMPFDEPEPQVTSPISKEHPWHTQASYSNQNSRRIHRDAFSYGKVGATIDSRVVVDLRFFGRNDPVETNTLTFSNIHRDGYDMPQPTFHFQMTAHSRKESGLMMADMTNVATKLGGYLPGSEPQFLEPGLALHLAGTFRAFQPGTKANPPNPSDNAKDFSVVNENSQVHGFTNLFLGGNGIIPTAFAANPTLTSMCYAIRASTVIAEKAK
ncbi:pyranose oxidase [Sistotremastrum suecicum HHB10207 ss-3]|uniref:Pyranose 2-oxidase n=1 Tax=Sistotremastrum suecicum HHB10207 ss-3 TaxID=1314776 RepID=A0A166BZ74_9AGAM|nr:pyranose oxidase [Sistotremastrum suecicum HHB10207 ss-3]